MKKRMWVTLLMLLFLVSACTSNEEHVYRGEGTDWEAVYHYRETSDDGDEHYMSLSYKGEAEDLKGISEITIRGTAGRGKIGGTIPVDRVYASNEPGVFQSNGSYEGLNLSEDIKIEVFVEWGEKKDILILQHEK